MKPIGVKALVSYGLPVLAVLLMISEPVLGQTSSGQFGAGTLIATVAILIVLGALVVQELRVQSHWTALFGFVVLAVTMNALRSDADERQIAKYILVIALCGLVAVLSRYISLGPYGMRGRMVGTFRALVLLGFAFSVPALLESGSRVAGFRASSPTLFSYTLVIAACVLLWCGRGLIDYVLVALAGWLVYLTGTRTNLVVLVLVVILYALDRLANVMRRNGWGRVARSAILAAICVAAITPTVAVMANFGSDTVLTAIDDLSQRSAAGDSTRTRTRFYSLMISELTPNALMVGRGAGYAFEVVSAGAGRRVAPHMDLLALTVDFGLGASLLLVGVLLFVATRAGLTSGVAAVVMAYLLAGQFHNVLFSPLALLVTVMAIALMLPRKRLAGIGVEAGPFGRLKPRRRWRVGLPSARDS